MGSYIPPRFRFPLPSDFLQVDEGRKEVFLTRSNVRAGLPVSTAICLRLKYSLPNWDIEQIDRLEPASISIYSLVIGDYIYKICALRM